MSNSPNLWEPKADNRSRSPEKKQSVSTFGRGYDGRARDDYRTPWKGSNQKVIEISSDSASEEVENPNDSMYESEDEWIVEDGGRYGGYKRPKAPEAAMATVAEYFEDDDGGYKGSKTSKTVAMVQEYFQDEADDNTYVKIADTDGDGDDGERCYGSYGSGEIPKTLKVVKQSKVAKTPGKPARATKREFEFKKEALAESFIQELDRKICDGAVGKFHEIRGGLKVEWNPKLQTTAGRARMGKGIIELSTRVITDEGRLRPLLASVNRTKQAQRDCTIPLPMNSAIWRSSR